MARLRAIFFGTPSFAVPSLRGLLSVADVVRVVTQPDKRAGRGMRVAEPPIKRFATERGISVVQPRKVRTAEFAASLRELEADVALVVAYGRILPASVLRAPRCGCLNVHASLLPRWRGAAPIQWCVAAGDEETGVCLMQMDEGMDTGPVLACERTGIGPDETADELSERLSAMAEALVVAHLHNAVDGTLAATPQSDRDVTTAPMLKKADGQLDWTSSAKRAHDLIRGMTPWPGAFSSMDGRRVRFHRARVAGYDGSQDPGVIVSADKHGIEVACGEGILAVHELQMDGKKRMAAADFLSGNRWSKGMRLGT